MALNLTKPSTPNSSNNQGNFQLSVAQSAWKSMDYPANDYTDVEAGKHALCLFPQSLKKHIDLDRDKPRSAIFRSPGECFLGQWLTSS